MGTTAAQDRQLLLSSVEFWIDRGRYADAYEKLHEVPARTYGRTQRWLLAHGALSLALYDRSVGVLDAPVAQRLVEAKRAAR